MNKYSWVLICCFFGVIIFFLSCGYSLGSKRISHIHDWAKAHKMDVVSVANVRDSSSHPAIYHVDCFDEHGTHKDILFYFDAFKKEPVIYVGD